MNNLIALIPARSDSTRIPMKNIRLLDGHPLLAYAIQSAIDSALFNKIYVSSDSDKIGEIANHYGAEFIRRPEEFARDDSPDHEWIEYTIPKVKEQFYFYSILRPTNPFRTSVMINRAWKEWDKKSIMKAVESVKQHPLKTWKISSNPKFRNRMETYIENQGAHFYPIQTLKKVYIQNGSLEFRSILHSNFEFQPFLTEGYEGFDINYIEDLILAEALIKKGWAKLQKIDRKPYDFNTV